MLMIYDASIIRSINFIVYTIQDTREFGCTQTQDTREFGCTQTRIFTFKILDITIQHKQIYWDNELSTKIKFLSYSDGS
jgi:hypothetical protein